MARKRDYKAEERRRNELARQRGFTSRAAERGAKKRQDFRKAGFRSHEGYTRARQKAMTRSAARSKTPATSFFPRMTAKQFRSHYNVFQKKHTSRKEFLRALADELHDREPDRFPYAYDEDREWWDHYLG